MYIKKLHIKNFKGLADISLEFGNSFNLIIGDNGAGKTSIIEAGSVVLGAFLAGIDGVRAIHFTQDEVRMWTETLGEGSTEIHHMLPIRVDSDLEVRGSNYHIVRQKRKLASARSTIEPRDIVKVAAAMAANMDEILPIITYQSFSRIASQKKDKWVNPFDKKYSRILGYTDCLDEASNTKLMTNWFKKMELISWQKKKPIAEYVATQIAIDNFMQVMLGQNDIHVYYDASEMELMINKNGQILPLRLLSSGFRTMMGMVLDIAYRMAVLNPFLCEAVTQKTDGVILIDEIDMHLHPNWQWRIIDALKKTFPQVQFIATTHSPLIISSCKNEDKIISLTANQLDKASYEPQYLTPSMGWQVNDVLQRQMRTEHRDPATTKKLNRLHFLGKKQTQIGLDDSEQREYHSLIDELKQLLPEGDLGVEEAAMFSIEDLLGVSNATCKENKKA